MTGHQRTGSFSILRAWIFDGLGFIQNHGAPCDGAQHFFIIAKLGVIDDKKVSIGNRFFGIGVGAVPNLDFEFRKEFYALVLPVVLNRFRTNHQHGFSDILFLSEPRYPGERLQCFTKAHVIREHATKVVGCEVGEKVKPFKLIRSQSGGDGFRCGWCDTGLYILDATFDLLHSLGTKQ